MNNPVALITRILKTAMALFVALIAVSMAVSMAHASSAPRHLQKTITAESRILTLGDVFADAPAEARAHVLGPAPEPGASMTLDARTLMRLAKAFEISWSPHTLEDRITITRGTNTLDAAALNKALGAALAEQGQDSRSKITFENLQPITLPLGVTDPDIGIHDIVSDAATGQISGVLSVSKNGVEIARAPFTGRMTRTVELPVLAASIKRGDIITASQLDWITMDATAVKPDMITDADDLIGTTPRRMIEAGKPLRAADLAMPQLVKRGDAITMVIKQGGLELTAKGRALDNGAKGDVIRVVNLASNKTLNGMIARAGEIIIE